MRQLDLSNYTVSVRNDTGVARFKEKRCGCDLDLVTADPVNPKIQGPNKASGECPKCGQLQPLVVPEFLELPYHVRDSLIEILLSRDNRLGGRELLKRDEIARKILSCTDGHFLLLEEEEWSKLVQSTDAMTALGRPDVELVHRILEAPKVEVEEKK